MKSNYPPDWFGCFRHNCWTESKLHFRVYLLGLSLSALSDLNEERVSKVADRYGYGFQLFLSGMKRRNEGCSNEKAEGGFEGKGDFHGTIWWFLLFWF